MAYIERDIDAKLEQWKNDSKRKPLLLRGVRQCGKTSAIRHLAEQFEFYVELNFEQSISLRRIFEGDLDIPKIVARLEIESETPILENRTLLFLDEIQKCPRAISALRFFYENMPGLHVIAAGSLLEFVLNGKNGSTSEFPVGRVRSMFLYPFSFREYLRSTNQRRLSDYLDSLNPMEGTNEFHERLLEQYKTFLAVGGMPEAVAEFHETGSLLACQQIHRDILYNMFDDFDKYDTDVSSELLRKVFDYAIHNVCRQTKASSAITDVSAYYFEECISLLKRAGILYPVKASSCETIPLGASEKNTNKKLLLFDSGVYLTVCRLDVGGMLAAEAFDEMNKGDVVEMQTGLEMIKYADVYRDAGLFYWYRTGANAEVDYVTDRGGVIVPIEVKASGKGRMQSMLSFLNIHPTSPYGIRISMENFSQYDRVRVFPVYAVRKLYE